MTAKILRHNFHCGIADGPDTTVVRPLNWNAEHDFQFGYRDVTGGTGAILNSDHLSLITTPGIDLMIAPGAGVFPTPLPGPNYGWHTCIRNVGPGGVVLSGSGGAQINGASSIELGEGQALNLYSVGPSNYAAIKIGAGGGGGGGAGRLEFVSATQLQYALFNGGHIMLDGTLRPIPPISAGGIAGLTNAGLVANTTYLVSATDIGGVLTADFRTGATHGPSQTAGNEGTEIIYVSGTPHDELSLIGMCRTNASAQFQDDRKFRFVASWFNPHRRSLIGDMTVSQLAAPSLTVSTWAELQPTSAGSMRVAWIGFSGRGGWITFQGNSYNTAQNFRCYSTFEFDGAAIPDPPTAANSYPFTDIPVLGNNYGNAFSVHRSIDMADGYHFAAPFGRVNGNQGTWQYSRLDGWVD